MSAGAFSRQRFAQVLGQTWDDEAFAVLDADARLLFLWSFTNPAATACGLYPASALAIARALARDVTTEVLLRASLALQALERKPLVLYDRVHEVLWVVSRARHSNTSARAQRLMQAEYARCPRSPLRDEFRRVYGQLLDLSVRGAG